MAQDVLCDVSNCQFWKEGNRCAAEQIYVVNEGSEMAANSSGTNCKTFIPNDELSI
ncbi:DUF1540 domain-containing protein [Bacillus marasmi]|uniref:DUF1540 domain-containing protein n=1 Tax=Bacillus marasmi TaxID=1926279 RepID=UPI0011CBBF15|nr:DUF1540 domain-containing protein [Bacillus marasmi]